MNLSFIPALGAALLCVTLTVRADEASEARLQQQNRALAQQLKTAQTEAATSKQMQGAAEAKNKTLEEQVKQQAKRLEELDKAHQKLKMDAEEIQSRQTADIGRLTAELTKHKAALDKWQTAHTTISEIARKKEAERAKFAAKAADLERKSADYRAKNLELYRLATEILERYNRFGVGEALAAREPFTGNAKVKLQNIVQDYNDKILDQTAKP